MYMDMKLNTYNATFDWIKVAVRVPYLLLESLKADERQYSDERAPY